MNMLYRATDAANGRIANAELVSTETFLYLYFCTVIDHWNNLSYDVVACTSVLQFKKGWIFS